MSSQHGPGLWVKKAKRLARISAETIKGTIQPIHEVRSTIDGTSVDTIFMVPEVLQTGVMMTKIQAKQQKRLVFRLDPDEGRIVYKPTTHIPIEAIMEIRTGSDARYYRQQFKLPEEMEERWMTVVYILDGTYKTLHIVADTRDVFHLWETSLIKIYVIRKGLTTGLGTAELRQTVWERQYWKAANKGGDNHVVNFEALQRLCWRLNANLTEKELRELFKECDSEQNGYLNFPDFQKFVKILQRRPDLEVIYERLSSTNGGKFDLPVFIRFMKQSQKSSLSNDELESLFETYAAGPTPVNELPEIMTFDGFRTYLTSQQNSAFSEHNPRTWEPMTRPISEYYVSSSHNTYLVGNQLVGVSTIEGYIRALLHSCRSVELDIYDGDKEPVVYHGNTLTSKVSLRDSCQAIAKYAFVASPYPIIISAEVHCGLEQQDKIVDIMTEVFGDSLIQAPVDGRPKIQVLPSPEDLKYQFLLKTKDLYVTEHLNALHAARLTKKETVPKPDGVQATTVPPLSESENDSDYLFKEGLKKTWQKMRGNDKVGSADKPKVKMSYRLAALMVYTVGIKCLGIESEIQYAPEHLFSLSENSADRFLKANMAAELIKHTHNHLVRIYPKGTRVYSTNYQPHRYWAAGAQIAAINWQTFDLGYRINQAMFRRNGRAGYVLKPEALRNREKGLLSKRTQHFFDVWIISAQQLPRPGDSGGHEIVSKSSVDPFVEVSLHIPDWTCSPFLPESGTAAGTRYLYFPSTDATKTTVSSARTVSLKTSVVKNNGFNPMWQEGLSLPFDCVGGMKDLIFVEFIVQHHQVGKLGENVEPLGVYCVPLACLEQGFRHLPLHDAQLSQHLYSTLFVQISIRDIN